MPLDRWEWVEGLKPESAIGAAVKHQAGLAADELLNWPPQVTWAEGEEPHRFKEILEPGSPRPSREAFAEAIKCVRWELSRDFDAIQYYERNNHRAKACPTARDQLASEFIQHYVLESFFGLMEKTNNRIKRADVLIGIDLFEKRTHLAWSELILL